MDGRIHIKYSCRDVRIGRECKGEPNPIPRVAVHLLTNAPAVPIQHSPQNTPACLIQPFSLPARRGWIVPAIAFPGGRKAGGTLLLDCACNKQDPTALTHRSRLAQTRRTKQQLGWAPQPTARAQSAFLALGAALGAQSHSFVRTGGSCQACTTGQDTRASWI